MESGDTNATRGPGVPTGHNTISPWVISMDTAALIDFAVAAFDA